MTTTSSTCPTCGDPVHQSGRGRPRRFCSDKCKNLHFNRRQNRARKSLKQPQAKICAHCGIEFIAQRRDRIYCYDKWCNQAAYQMRKRGGEGRRVVEHEVACHNCGSVFTAKYPTARWCSVKCANRFWGNARARQRGRALAGGYADRDIFERDGWRCHICGKTVDRLAKRTSPRGATIDHLIPLSLGGDDVESNVATAHYICNVRKQTKAVNDQLRLL